MCCIVLKFYYLCVVIGDKPVISNHEFLKYSTLQFDLRFNPSSSFCHDVEKGGPGRSKSIAMKNYFL
jgi:hypothetical protein